MTALVDRCTAPWLLHHGILVPKHAHSAKGDQAQTNDTGAVVSAESGIPSRILVRRNLGEGWHSRFRD